MSEKLELQSPVESANLMLKKKSKRPPPRKLECKLCEKVIVAYTRSHLISHLRQHTSRTSSTRRNMNDDDNFNHLDDSNTLTIKQIVSNPYQHFVQNNSCNKMSEKLELQSPVESADLMLKKKRKKSTPRKFKCKLCKKVFSGHTSGHLVSHLRQHTSEKEFECEKCDKLFHHEQGMHIHMFTCTVERPLQRNIGESQILFNLLRTDRQSTTVNQKNNRSQTETSIKKTDTGTSSTRGNVNDDNNFNYLDGSNSLTIEQIKSNPYQYFLVESGDLDSSNDFKENKDQVSHQPELQLNEDSSHQSYMKQNLNVLSTHTDQEGFKWVQCDIIPRQKKSKHELTHSANKPYKLKRHRYSAKQLTPVSQIISDISIKPKTATYAERADNDFCWSTHIDLSESVPAISIKENNNLHDDVMQPVINNKVMSSNVTNDDYLSSPLAQGINGETEKTISDFISYSLFVHNEDFPISNGVLSMGSNRQDVTQSLDNFIVDNNACSNNISSNPSWLNNTPPLHQLNLLVNKIHVSEEQSEVEDKRPHLNNVADNFGLSLNEEDKCNVEASSSAAILYAALVADLLGDIEDGMDDKEVIPTDNIVSYASVATQTDQSFNINTIVATSETIMPSQNQLV